LALGKRYVSAKGMVAVWCERRPEIVRVTVGCHRLERGARFVMVPTPRKEWSDSTSDLSR